MSALASDVHPESSDTGPTFVLRPALQPLIEFLKGGFGSKSDSLQQFDRGAANQGFPVGEARFS